MMSTANAQNPGIMDLSLEDLKHVQVYSASMYLQSDHQAPSAITVITADQIRKFGYRTLGDALRSVRGFDITYDRNYTTIDVRGFSRPGGYNDQVLLLINGHRLNDNVYGSAQLGTEFPLDVDLIERIEIVRGPSSSLYGSNAFIAVINVIARNPESIDGFELSGEGGGFTTYRVRSTVAGTYHGVEGIFSGTLYNSDGAVRLFFPVFNTPATNNGYALNADRDSSRSFFSTLHFGDFTLSAVGSRREKGIPTASYNQRFNDNRAQTVDSSGFLNLEYKRTIPHNAEFIANAYFDRTLYHGVYVFPPDGEAENALLEDASHGECLGFNARVAKTLWQRHKAAIGAEFRDNLSQVQTTYHLHPFQSGLDDRRSSREWGVYVQDEFMLAKNLILNAGVRHDKYPPYGGTTNPRLALIYSPRQATTLKWLYGQAFRAPSDYELYYTDHITQEANPRLQAEKIRTGEMIWEQDLGATFRLALSAFANQITDLINQQIDPQNGFIFFKTVHGVHSQGLEMELSAKTRGGIEGRASCTLQSVDPSLTYGLVGAPSQLIKANLAFPVAKRRFHLGVELQSTGSRTTLEATKLDGYVISNFTISSRQFASGFRVSASLYNVFNTRYYDPVGAEIRGAAVQQNGRDFRVQLLHTFSFK